MNSISTNIPHNYVDIKQHTLHNTTGRAHRPVSFVKIDSGSSYKPRDCRGFLQTIVVGLAKYDRE